MLRVSEKAANHFHEICGADNSGAAIRVAVIGAGGGNGLGLMADTVKDTDYISQHGSFTVIIDQKLIDYCRTITIDFNEGEPDGCASRSGRGFLLSAGNPVIF